ncbi:MAG: hypothetical protein PHO56_00215 [Patescibacteria group bacterium]|nr:hypothetical protein [Patescibacteria group bacterium]
MFGMGKIFGGEKPKTTEETPKSSKAKSFVKAAALGIGLTAGSIMAGEKAPENKADFSKDVSTTMEIKGKGAGAAQYAEKTGENKTLEQLQAEQKKINEANREHNKQASGPTQTAGM